MYRISAGFSYIGVMVTLVIAGIGMQGAAVMWQYQSQRIKEAQLLEVGEAYRLAIGRYYEANTQAIKEYPVNLDVLVEDKRFPTAKRHLRKRYTDPFFVNQDMVLIVKNGRIIGVRSQALGKPMRMAGYQEFQTGFKEAKKYSDWEFVYQPNTLPELESAWASR